MTDPLATLSPENRFAILTPTNRGAIAVLRVWGPGAVHIADAVFRPSHGRRLSASPTGRLRLGRVGNGLGDEVVAVVLKAKNGQTDDFTVEIQCHGGPSAWELVARSLESAGASQTTEEEWTRYAFDSPLRAAAWSDLSRAKTTRVAEILLDQAHGALEREIKDLINLLKNSHINFPACAESSLDALIQRAEVGLRLISGWRIVLAGRPNVGKSSLLNALAGYKRSIVDATPGTTRDIITLSLAVDGWPIELSDTAGLREASEALEKIGIDRALRAQQQADLILPVVDRSEALTPIDLELIRSHSHGQLPIVANKADLPPAWSPAHLGAKNLQIVDVSTKDGAGIEMLLAAIGRGIVEKPMAETIGVPFRQVQVDLLHEARLALSRQEPVKAVHLLNELLTIPASDDEGPSFARKR